MPDMETETNPIDRTVAHLLFHRPAELSGKHPETPESPVVSTKLPSERNTRGLLSLPRGFFPDNYKIPASTLLRMHQTMKQQMQELSGKHPETPESPVVSTKLPSERNTHGLLSLPRGFFPDNYKSKHNLSYTAGSKNPYLFAEGDHSKNSSCIDTSENASNNEAADAGCMEIELSQ
ncbi:hypothetical protein TEA_011181 [Camellia sinensis var. sinensis]|uniref:Uncharacterized protein n=1 Tax=Camellia sinensis var. sinensis TaxID=542762 RepID=A0A4S4DDY0_CAMSN|nr:hypothetical protein TEA_011181 [Camellia sinensis var. sinensis]